MSTSENNPSGFKKCFTRSAIGAAVAMLLSLILMLAVAALLADGKIAPERAGKAVMLCVFEGCFLATLLTTVKQGRGVLTAAILHSVMYIVLLMVFAMAIGAERIFNAGFLKTAICAASGCVLAGTMCVYRNGRPSKRRKRR